MRNLHQYLSNIAERSEAVGRLNLELERLQSELGAANAERAAQSQAYIEQRQQFIRMLADAACKSDFDHLVPDFHALLNAGIAVNSSNGPTAKLQTKIRQLTDELEFALRGREESWAALVKGDEPALQPMDPPAPARPATPPPAKLDAAQATRLALDAEQALLGKPHAPRLPDARDTSSIQDQLLSVLRNAGRPMAVAAVHQVVEGQFSLTQVRDNLSVLYRAGRVKRLERGIYDCK